MNSFQRDNLSNRFTGWHLLVIFLVFFGVVIAVNVTMAVVAQRSWTGLVVNNTYVASQNFNSELAEARRQSQRGWISELRYVPGQVKLSLRDDRNQPVVLSNLVLAYGRPAYERADETSSFMHVGDGIYHAQVRLKPGIWLFRVSGGAGLNSYRRDSRVYVSRDGKMAREE
ncbi:MAG: hypothetical protein TECD_00825 [Hyphomicrobiaceae bacterium hypho_1]